MPANHEFSLAECLAEEIRTLRRIESLKADLTSRYDYTNYACFRTLDLINDSYIKPNDIREFYRNSYQYPSEKEILALIRRIDTDGDCKIGFNEFSDFMRVARPINRSMTQQQPRRDFSASKMG